MKIKKTDLEDKAIYQWIVAVVGKLTANGKVYAFGCV